MATTPDFFAPTTPRARDDAAVDQRFAATMAIAMAVVVVAGFSTQFLAGRSTFASPVRVHIHAVVFIGWVAIFVAQAWLATRGPLRLHRQLGWLAVGWMVVMVGAALAVMVAVVRQGTAPFFFQPQEFLIANPLALLGFVGLTGAAVAMRRRTDWHARLHICGMTMIMGPAFGRMLPMPLLIPYAFEAAGVASALFPIAGMIRDRRHLGSVHPAWWCGLGVLAVVLIAPNYLAATPFGDWLYATAVAASPGEAVPGLAFAPPPAGPLLTGR
ncbi:MAG: hypothetical protein ABW194_04495 [Novosphingobium sp.]